MARSDQLTDPYALERERENARRVAAGLSRESTSVVRVRARKVSYDVTWRWPNGKPYPKNRIMRILLGILYILWVLIKGITEGILEAIIPPTVGLVYLVVSVIVGLVQGQRRPKPAPTDTGRVSVSGNADCAALPLADALRDTGEYAWLAWSNSQVTLLSAGTEQPEVLWSGSGEARPECHLAKNYLEWPDKSRVTFDLSPAEQERLKARNGTM